jgi:hypothetical protein
LIARKSEMKQLRMMFIAALVWTVAPYLSAQSAKPAPKSIGDQINDLAAQPASTGQTSTGPATESQVNGIDTLHKGYYQRLKDEKYQDYQVDKAYDWIKDLSIDQLFDNGKQQLGESMDLLVSPELARSITQTVNEIPTSASGAMLNVLGGAINQAGRALSSDFLEITLPSALGSAATGAFFGETLRSDDLQSPRQGQTGPSAVVTWQQQDTADAQAMTDFYAKTWQNTQLLQNGLITNTSTIAVPPATLYNQAASTTSTKAAPIKMPTASKPPQCIGPISCGVQ